MNHRILAASVALVTFPASTAFAHSPDCYRDVGLGTLVIFVVAIVSGAFWMERTFGSQAKGAAPVIAWVGLVGISLLLSATVGMLGILGLCG